MMTFKYHKTGAIMRMSCYKKQWYVFVVLIVWRKDLHSVQPRVIFLNPVNFFFLVSSGAILSFSNQSNFFWIKQKTQTELETFRS
jgi:hypothetical protein